MAKIRLYPRGNLLEQRHQTGADHRPLHRTRRCEQGILEGVERQRVEAEEEKQYEDDEEGD